MGREGGFGGSFLNVFVENNNSFVVMMRTRRGKMM